MSKCLDLADAPPISRRMSRLARYLSWTAVAAAVAMHVAALAALAGPFLNHLNVARPRPSAPWLLGSFLANAASLSPSSLLGSILVALVAGLTDAFAVWLQFGFIWFFARYFAYVLQTRAEALRSGNTSDIETAPEMTQP
jgi:hypothetical protein